MCKCIFASGFLPQLSQTALGIPTEKCKDQALFYEEAVRLLCAYREMLEQIARVSGHVMCLEGHWCTL